MLSNPYKAKHPWPPDFSLLGKQDQFRFERKFKRRMRLASARPRWMMVTGLLQIATVTILPAYMVLFMEWPASVNHPFGPLRQWMHKKTAQIWSLPPPPPPAEPTRPLSTPSFNTDR